VAEPFGQHVLCFGSGTAGSRLADSNEAEPAPSGYMGFEHLGSQLLGGQAAFGGDGFQASGQFVRKMEDHAHEHPV
jgi:hypothetical protein